MIQTGLIAGTIPIGDLNFCGTAEGKRHRILNSGRFAGHALGPIMATSVLAISNLPSLYLLISGLTCWSCLLSTSH